MIKTCRCGKPLTGKQIKYCSAKCASHYYFQDHKKTQTAYCRNWNKTTVSERLPAIIEDARFKAVKNKEKIIPILSNEEIFKIVDGAYRK